MQLGWIDSASTALDRTDSHGQMSCHGLHAVTIPSWVNAAKHTALGLDFSSGCLVDISSLCSFLYLQTLVLDHNQLKSIRLLPALPTLRALSLNDNELEELHSTLISIQKKCGNITFLSLLGNPCYPCELSSTSYLTQRAYEKHRAMVRLPATMRGYIYHHDERALPCSLNTSVGSSNSRVSVRGRLQVVMALPQLQYLDFRATDTEIPLVPEWLRLDTLASDGSKSVLIGSSGQFLVTELGGSYMLLVNCKGTVARYNIASDERGLGFRFGGQAFRSLESLIEHVHKVNAPRRALPPARCCLPSTCM
jgi:hypothetical protein